MGRPSFGFELARLVGIFFFLSIIGIWIMFFLLGEIRKSSAPSDPFVS